MESSFANHADCVHALWQRGEHREASTLVRRHADRLPERRATLVFWEACFSSLGGDPEASLEVLQGGLEAGLWWAEPTLRGDPDLEAARALDGFDHIARRSGVAWRLAAVSSPPDLVVVPCASPTATLVVLHGSGGLMDDALQAWSVAASCGCMVAIPGHGQPINSDGTQHNWMDPSMTDLAVAAAVTAGGPDPVLIGGFSAGGREALRIGLTGTPCSWMGSCCSVRPRSSTRSTPGRQRPVASVPG